MAVSSGFIWVAVPQSSGAAGGRAARPGLAGDVTFTCPEPAVGQSASVARYCSRTSSARASRFSAVQPSVGIGGRTVTCTVPEWIVLALRHISSPALRMTIGTIGTPACIATWKAPFLNGRERRGRRPGALRRDHQRDAVAQLLHRGPEAPCRLTWCCAVDERHVGEPEHQPEPGAVGQLLLRHPGEPAVQQLGQDEHVELALVVEQEDRRPGRPGARRRARPAAHRPAGCPARRRTWCRGRRPPAGSRSPPAQRRAGGEAAEHPRQPRRRAGQVPQPGPAARSGSGPPASRRSPRRLLQLTAAG